MLTEKLETKQKTSSYLLKLAQYPTISLMNTSLKDSLKSPTIQTKPRPPELDDFSPMIAKTKVIQKSKKENQKPIFDSTERIKTKQRLTQQRIRIDPVRATPVARNNQAVQLHFQKFLRSTSDLKPPSINKAKPSEKIKMIKGASNSCVLSYLQKCEFQTFNLTKDCSFTPSLLKTQRYNQQVRSKTPLETTFERQLKWSERRDNSIESQRLEKFQDKINDVNLTFRPNLTSRSSSQIMQNNSEDTQITRQMFKQINGVDKYLEKQFKAMCNREEVRLMEHNLGKVAEKQLTVSDVISTKFAYQDMSPSYHINRISLLNPLYDGSQIKKYKEVPDYRKKKNIGGFDYKNIRKFLNKTIKTQL